MNPPQAKPQMRDAPPRRSFFVRFAATVLGAIAVVFPFAAGLGMLLDPLRRGRANGTASNGDKKFTPICPLDDLPADGVPRRFAVVTDIVDAWTRRSRQPIGAVYMSRTGDEESPKVIAFTTTCPHLGCAVEYDAAEKRFECPCHESGFATDGTQLFGPSRRGLDPLEVKLEPRGDQLTVWVAYQRFRTGIANREPIA
jgi:nitrite reductase/ring-hydroxylating ferredoxin subunit